jgi:hypothetical protein
MVLQNKSDNSNGHALQKQLKNNQIFDLFVIYFCSFLVPISFCFAVFASFVFVSLLISNFSLRSKTSEKTDFFASKRKKFAYFSHRFASTKNERRTLAVSLILQPKSWEFG